MQSLAEFKQQFGANPSLLGSKWAPGFVRGHHVPRLADGSCACSAVFFSPIVPFEWGPSRALLVGAEQSWT